MARAGKVDFALTLMTGNDTALSCNPLLSDRPCLVYSEDHPLSDNHPVKPEALLPYHFIKPPLDTSSHQMIERFQREAGSELTFAAVASRLMTLEVMVRAGLGLLILPALSARLCAHSGLRFCPIDCESVWRCCQIIHQLHRQHAPIVTQVIEATKMAAKVLQQDTPDLMTLQTPVA